jgi:cytochrome c556
VFSLLVGIILIFLIVFAIYVALGKLGLFKKVGKATSDLGNMFKDENPNSKTEGDL